jgi:hypothetical protein
MRGSEFLRALKWPAAFVFGLTVLQAALYLNGIGWWAMEFIGWPGMEGFVVAGSLLAAVAVLLFLLVTMIRRRWALSLRLFLFAIAFGGTPFLMSAAAEYAQVARFYLQRDVYKKRVESLPIGSRLVAFPWCEGDCRWHYNALVFDEQDKIPMMKAGELTDQAWIRRAEKIPLLCDCASAPWYQLVWIKQRSLGGHFYLVTCGTYYGP